MVDGKRTENLPRNGEGDRPCERGDGGGGPAILQARIKQVKRARKLRRQMSLPEVLLWKVLQTRPGGFKFRKQFPFENITADFACLERRLIIEVDGEHHSYGDRPRKDDARDAMLKRAGFRVLRLPAKDVLKNMDGAITWILAHCRELGPLHHAAPRHGPPPRSGEEFS